MAFKFLKAKEQCIYQYFSEGMKNNFKKIIAAELINQEQNFP
jgi:hypothetical protein